jgi:acyl carrier protein
MNPETLRLEVAQLVDRATQGGVRATDALAGQFSLAALGLDSLGLLRIVDAIELAYGVEIDAGGGGRRVDTLDDLVARIIAAGAA